MLRLVQMRHASGRRVAAVENERLRLLIAPSVYALAQVALRGRERFADAVRRMMSDETLDYDAVYNGQSDWKLLPCFDHPDEPARCLVSGTGLTHRASAENRDAMHGAADTDSMRMYRWGVEGGRPATGEPGAAPEWFYKGNGTVLRAHGEALEVPAHADDGGEEPEIAGCYVIDELGRPRRAGFAIANEFSDHVLEKKNYLYLAASKLRTCAIGPELVVDGDFSGTIPGEVRIERGGQTVWSKAIATGEERMCHTLANLEHHHFKFEQHCTPGDAHVHFFGAGAFSFGEGVALENGDIMSIAFEGFGRALRNPVRVESGPQRLVSVTPL